MSVTWLVTVRQGTSLEEIKVHTSNKKMEIILIGEPVPMTADEEVFEILAPDNFDKVLKIDDRVLSIHPSSKPHKF